MRRPSSVAIRWIVIGALGVSSTAPRAARSLQAQVVVHGAVFDSILGTPLTAAKLQLVGADTRNAAVRRSATSDSSGHFAFSDVPAGRYLVGFYHPALDSLGLEAAEREYSIDPAHTQLVLGTPSVETIIAGLCGASAASDTTTGLLLGHVRDAHEQTAVENGTVVVSWAMARWTTKGFEIRDSRATAQLRSAGWFALCGVPRETPLTLRVARAADSSVAVGARVPPSRLLHVSLAVARHGFLGRLAGSVVDEVGRPVTSAEISSTARTVHVNDQGAFVLDSLPLGTQEFAVRAIGFSPLDTVLETSDVPGTTHLVKLERVTVLAGMVARDSVAAAHLSEFLHNKKVDVTGAEFVQPARLPGYPAMEPVCKLIADKLYGLTVPDCGPGGRMVACEGFLLNGLATRLPLQAIDPDDIVGVEVYKHVIATRYMGQFGSMKHLCPIVVWTRCSGGAVPTCRG